MGVCTFTHGLNKKKMKTFLRCGKERRAVFVRICDREES